MGGGSGSRRRWSPETLKKLESQAKEIIRSSEYPTRRSVFISFSSEDLNQVNLLRGQAKNENSELDFIDRSLQEPFDSDKAEYIRAGIRERIRQSSVTLVYLSEKSATSKWVTWEIEESIRQGKGIVGVFSTQEPPAILPAAFQSLKAELVPWEQTKLTSAISRAALGRAKE